MQDHAFNPFHRTANSAPIPILMYHQISVAPPRGAPWRGLYVHPKAFARQMWFLRTLGYQGLSMTALLPYLRGEKQGKVVGITFDDGYQNNLTQALPVLQRHGFSATCYVVSGLVGQSNRWDHAQGMPSSPLMTADELRQWVQSGQEVGAHTVDHVHLPQLGHDDAQHQIAHSKAQLEGMIDTPVSHFCYPYGDYQPAHVQMAQAVGFVTTTSTQRGRVQSGDAAHELPRVAVSRTSTLAQLSLKVLTRYEDKRRQQRLAAYEGAGA